MKLIQVLIIKRTIFLAFEVGVYFFAFLCFLLELDIVLIRFLAGGFVYPLHSVAAAGDLVG